MVKLTIKFDYPTERAFLQSYLWSAINNLLVHMKVLSFRIEEVQE